MNNLHNLYLQLQQRWRENIQTARIDVQQGSLYNNEARKETEKQPKAQNGHMLMIGSSIGRTGYSGFLGRILIKVGRNTLTSMTS